MSGPRPRRARALLLAALLGIGGAAILLRGSLGPPSTGLPAPPDPDTRGVERAVAERIRAGRGAVLERPDSAEAWGRLGRILDVHNLLPEAIACYEQAARLDPADFRWPYLRATSMPEGNPEAVLDALLAARALRSDYPALNLRVGQSLLRLGRPAEARAHFEAALRAEPEGSHALLGLAEIAFEEGNAAESRELLERAVRSRPSHREVHALLARVYRALGLEDLASESSRTAGALPGKTSVRDPLRAEVFAEGASAVLLASQGAAALRAGRAEIAAERYRAALAARPEDADARVGLASALLAGGNAEEGISTLEEVLRARPAHLAAKSLLARAFSERRDFLEAEGLFREILDADPGDGEARYRFALLLLGNKRFTESVAILREGIDREPPHPERSNALAWLLATLPDERLRDGPTAVRLAESLCRSEGFTVHWHLGTLGAAYAEVGRFEDAVRATTEAVRIAERAGDGPFLEAARRRLTLFESRRAFHDGP